MERCTFCGAELPLQAQFCGSCGRLVSHMRDLPTHMLGYQTMEMSQIVDAMENGPTLVTDLSQPELRRLQQGDVISRRNSINRETPRPHFIMNGNEEDDEEDKDEVGFLPLGQQLASGVPLVQGMPQLNGVPMVPSPSLVPGSASSLPPILMSPSSPNALLLQGKVPNSWPSSPSAPTVPATGTTSQPQPTGSGTSTGTGSSSNPGSGSSGNPGGSGCGLTLLLGILVLLIIIATLGGLFVALPPTISLVGSSSVVSGSTLQIHGTHFVPGSNVSLTLDNNTPLFALGHNGGPAMAQQSVSTAGLSLSLLHTAMKATSNTALKASTTGSFDIAIPVNTSWSLGQHTIHATESIGGRSTALTFTINAPPAKLLVKPQTLDFGKLEVGSKAILSIVVSNGGQQPLNWQANVSGAVKAPWLSLQPASGTIQGSTAPQFIYVTGDTSQLKVGTYTATIQINSNSGTSQVSVKLEVTPPSPKPVAKLAVTPTSLDFGSLDIGTQLTRSVTISNTGTAALKWTADNGTANWVTLDTLAQTIQPGAKPDIINVTVDTTNLSSSKQTATLTINSNGGKVQVAITVVVNAPPQPCTLQAPSTASLTFNVNMGSDPQPQSVTDSVTGNCTAGVTITPTVTMVNGSGWLAVSPSAATIVGGTTTFSVNVTSSALSPGTYSGLISIDAVSNGSEISGSIQSVSVSLTVTEVPPVLAVSPGTLSINLSNGDSAKSYAITITNTGGSSLQWHAALDTKVSSFVTLSSSSTTTLAAGASTTINVNVNPNNQQAGNYSDVVTVTATDPITGQATSGSPATVSVSITLTAQPSMQVSPTSLTFTPAQCTYTASGTVYITNTGGGTLSWNVASPVYGSGQPTGWLTVTPTSGSDQGALKFSANDINSQLVSGQTYTATVTITPSVGSAQPVSVSFTIPSCLQ